MKLKTILLTIVAAFLFLPSGLAYDVNTLMKQNKKLIKQIKKQHGDVVVTPVVSSDSSYYYFLVEDHAKKVGVADHNGNLIVPIKYISILYFPPVEEGVSKVNCISPYYSNDKIEPNEFVEVYHKKTDASFFAIKSEGGDFYNLAGKLVASSKYHSIRSLPGYVLLMDGKYTDSKKLYGVATKGKNSLALGAYNSFMIYRSDGTLIYDNIGRFEFVANDKIKYGKRMDRIFRFGLLNVRDPQKSIPCYYREINVDSDKITVQKNILDTLVTYSPELDKNGIFYLDDGERFYDEYDWYSAIDYYKTKGVNAPWANFISAQAHYDIAKNKARWIEDFIKKYDTDPTNLEIDLKSNLYRTETFDEAHEFYKLANERNNAYLAGSDTIFLAHAHKLQSALNNALAEFDSQRAKLIKIREMKENQLEKQRKLEIQNAIQRLEEREREYQAQKAQQLEAQKKAQQLNAQKKAQQQQVSLSILSAINNTLTQTAYKQNNSNNSSSVSGSMQRTSNNATINNNNSVSKPDNSGRKAFLRGEIITWNNKIKKAEAAYRQAVNSGEDTWQKKRVIESKRKTVEEYLEVRRQLEAELNSLK